MSNCVEVIIVVEGSTEQTFIRDVLAPEMGYKNIFLHAALIGKPGHKGGDIRFDRAKNDLVQHLRQRSNTYISTMFDYFRIAPDWPGRAGIPDNLPATRKAEKLEKATKKKLKEIYSDYNVDKRFIPYIEMHEFEALLFSDASVLAETIDVSLSRIKAIIKECGEPEEINEESETAPSKRLTGLRNGYRKVAMGKTISERIGITTMRDQCPHFNAWLSKLERLS